MEISIESISRSQREEMFNLHATFVNPDATERSFYRIRVPVKTIDLMSIPADVMYYSMSDQEIKVYLALLQDPGCRYPVISNGFLIDGMHRITAAVCGGRETMEVLDFTGLINPQQSGFVTPVQVIDPQPRISPSRRG